MDGVNGDAVITHKDMEFLWEAHRQLPERSAKESLLGACPPAPLTARSLAGAPQVYEPSPTLGGPKLLSPKG